MYDITIFFIYIYCLAALAVLLARGSIFEELKAKIIAHINARKLELYIADFLFCPMCIGFWIGLFAEVIFWYLKPEFGFCGLIMSGSAVSISATILLRLIEKKEDI